ncbi:MAG: hypothetical protein HY912_06175 [Desulfomonile tiedjei]|uniref:Uncharacterized protein n=1 Tax=Desulfomonile tiedjei TaxID=2358 RepID=A0A9D6V049_9BACT|nr:hypothetical protein [Desulfomonile tiedjei]
MSEDKVNKKEKKGFFDAVKEFFLGMAVHEAVMVALKEKAATENLLFLAIFGDMIGMPVMPKYYSLRLVPYLVPKLDTWKRSVLRERDWTDWAFD